MTITRVVCIIIKINKYIFKPNLSGENDFMYKKLYKSWLDSGKLDDKEIKELNEIENQEKEIEYRFGKDLEFGTAGMRGII